MENLAVGILENKSDRLMADVASRLSGVRVEFISAAEEKLPIERNYRVIIDRLSFRFLYFKEMLKSLALNGTYIINNPFAASTTNKIVDIGLGKQLGINFPRTIALPNQAAFHEEISGLVRPPNLGQVAAELGLPCILKPFDGYAWDDVYVVWSLEELKNLYAALSPRHILLAQQIIKYKDYLRVFCFNRQDVLFMRWVPKPMAMGHYLYTDQNSVVDISNQLAGPTVQLNQTLDLDVNVIEWCLDDEGRWWVIDAFNEVPDVIPEALPAEHYGWIVDRFAACVRDKLDPAKKNRSPFLNVHDKAPVTQAQSGD